MWQTISILILISLAAYALFYLRWLKQDRSELKNIFIVTNLIGLSSIWVPRYFISNEDITIIFGIFGLIILFIGLVLSSFFKKKYPESK